MIVLFTDYGLEDAYVGQLHAVIAQAAPGEAVIDLLHHVPNHDIRAGAYLLPAYAAEFPEGTVFVCVVDPGVGGARQPVMLRAFGQCFVGPDNGLFQMLARRDNDHQAYVIEWRPRRLSRSFHGRDLFAPVAAMLARGQFPQARQTELVSSAGSDWPDDLAQVILVDHFGNATTGVRADAISSDARLTVHGKLLSRANTFSDVPVGDPLWYENANGLIEIAVNQGSAAEQLSIRTGDPVEIM
jgi:S-adenosylmethionine hydrolase